ncbi:Eye-specific diacylglycerol kinase [Armadillidium nasatum]|uniref:Eye-specific diacylglycerol kinase n=1 Tax=Armadillidium nasatum TaxID=96803 RepID=A0A5N5T3E8_9CRUS|nr:Eye-specific diacylglycerol kinase [Armadillidium nasatum]
MNISKIRRSLMRSRTPTGAEMKQQNSLEVPPQVRSASFDEMQLKPGGPETPAASSLPAERQSFLLKVPYLGPKRSKSFDSGCGDVEDPYPTSSRRRPLSVEKTANYCVHCAYLEEIERKVNETSDESQPPSGISFTFHSFSSSSKEAEEEEEWEEDDSSNDELHEVICGIKVTLSPNSPSSASPTYEEPTIIAAPPVSPSRRPSTAKLERQPAISCPPIAGESSSQENSFDTSDGGYSHNGSQLYLGSSSEYGDVELPNVVVAGGSEPSTSRRPSIGALRTTRSAEEYKSNSLQAQGDAKKMSVTTKDIYLEVPSRRDRAASLDLAFSYKTPDEMQNASTGLTRSISLEPPSSLRSKSIDIELPTTESHKYKVVVTSPQGAKKAINSEVEIQCGNGEKRVLRASCDWTETAVNGDHLWCQTSASGDFCYVGDDFCCVSVNNC